MDNEKPMEESSDLAWVTEQLNQDFERLFLSRYYSDDPFRELVRALSRLGSVPDELDDLLVNLGGFP